MADDVASACCVLDEDVEDFCSEDEDVDEEPAEGEVAELRWAKETEGDADDGPKTMPSEAACATVNGEDGLENGCNRCFQWNSLSCRSSPICFSSGWWGGRKTERSTGSVSVKMVLRWCE